MKSTRITLFIISFFITTSTAHSVAGIGDLVSDPGSYSYYVDQIYKMEQQIDQAMKAYEKQILGIEKLKQMKNRLEGQYNRVAGLPARMEKRIKSLEYTTKYKINALSKDAEYFSSNQDKLYKGEKLDDWEQVNLDIDRIWGKTDPSASAEKKERQAAIQKAAAQRLSRNSLQVAATLLKGMENRTKEIDRLSNEIGGKKSLSEHVALSNRLLLEIIYGQKDMLRVFASMAQASAAKDYTGSESLERIKKRFKEIKLLKKTGSESAIEKRYRKIPKSKLDLDSKI